MIRWLFILIGSLLAFSLLRSIIGMVTSVLTGSEQPAPGTPREPGDHTRAAPKQNGVIAEALVKDPVCGTFVTSSSQWVTRKDGETYRFCSAECRDKFAA